jgi:hypothetical protein
MLILIGLCLLAGLLWGANWFFVSKFVDTEAKQGQFGDMFGSVNALFTALAFAGLIYTVLLQRDQLALQQQEIIESGKTQELLVQKQIAAQADLFERQKLFQEEQRQKQIDHDLKLEQLRQDFEELVEGRRKDREKQADDEFTRNVLRAIRRELEALAAIYDKGMGARLTNTPIGQPLDARLAITQDWFTVFSANAVNLGKVDGAACKQIVLVYALLKGLIEEYRINNELLAKIDEAVAVHSSGFPVRVSVAVLKAWNVTQTGVIRTVDAALKSEVQKLFSLLDERGVS